jgi:TonB-dependent starch-binding outer membrane protein SusC
MQRSICKVLLSFATMLMMCTMVFAQDKTIQGQVTDASNSPLTGVTVVVQGTTNGTITDIDGNYSIKVQPNSKLQFSFVGYLSQTIDVKNQATINVKLYEQALDLDEVVVVGYGTIKKNDLTGSVGSINSENLIMKGSPSILQSMQGSVAGVSITQSGSRDQAGFDIQIRGKSSINTDVKPLYVVDGIICGDIDFLNPQDIDRIDILKDASSTAIYGSRATAGVVLVTTKSGVTTGVKIKSKASVSYDAYYGANQLARMPNFMNGEEFYRFRFLQFLQQSAGSYSQPPYFMMRDAHQQAMLFDGVDKLVLKENLANNKTYDWPMMVTRNGMEQNHYLSVNGSSDMTSYHFGVGYNGNEGVYVGDEQQRFNIKASIDSKISNFVSAGVNINMAYMGNDYGSDEGIKVAYRMNPFNVPYDKEGNMNIKPGNFQAMGTSAHQFTDAYNPLAFYENEMKEKDAYRMLGNVYLEIKPIKNLSLKTTLSPNYAQSRTGFYSGNAVGGTPVGSYTLTRSFDWTWDNIANYNLSVGDHSLNAMGLFSMNAYNYERYYLSAQNPTVGTTYHNIGTAGKENIEEFTSSYTENSMVSYAFRANYSFKGKYMVTATVRSDGSSKFASGYRWGTFPSAALAWRISEEEFLKNDWMSNLKLRLSYGVTGNNSGIGNYDTQTTGAGPNYYAFGSQVAYGYYPSGVVNAALAWETTHETNLGIDFGFLDNRINGTIDVYNKDSKGLLYERELPLVSGGGTLITNIGNVRNRGIELSLNVVKIQNKNWRWETNFNFAANHNEVLEINGTSDQILGGTTKTLMIGEPVNNIYSYNWAGIVSDKMIEVPDNVASSSKGFTPGSQVKSADYYYSIYKWTEGMPIIEDLNGDGIIDADNDKKILGSRDPKWIGSITTSLTYKNWDLMVSVYTKQNYKVYSNFLFEYYNYAYRGYQHLTMDYYIPAGALVDCDYINEDGTIVNPVYQEQTHYGEFPFPNATTANYGTGSVWLEKGENNLGSIVDASYWKVKNIVLGYTLPKNMLDKAGIEKLRLYMNITNPFVFTSYKGFDPEWAGAETKNDGPSFITYQFGINLSF